MPRFVRILELPVPARTLWDFHERPDALQLLMPPDEPVEILESAASLAVGSRVVLRQRLGPVRVTIVAEHVEYEPGHVFADRMTGGPFRTWLHRHIVEPTATGSRLTDDIEYTLPGGRLADFFVGRWVTRKLDRMFAHRHAVTRRFCLGEPAAA